MAEICKVQKAPIHVFYSEDQKIGDMGIGEYAIYKSILYVLDHRNQINNDDTVVKAIAQGNLVPLVVGDVVKTIFDNNTQNMLNLREGIEQRVINQINDLSALKDLLAGQAAEALTGKVAELEKNINDAIEKSKGALNGVLEQVEQAKASAVNTIDEKTRRIEEYKVPIGTIIAMSSDYIPAGYLLCNGAAVNRQTYSLLFAKIGTTYGEGDGTNTFNLPDLRGKFLRGLGGNSDLLGKTQGDAIRNITGKFVTRAPYAEDISHTSGPFRAEDTSWQNFAQTPSGGAGITMDFSRVVPTANENRPINMAMNYLIKASGSDIENANLEEIRIDGIPIGGYLDYASDAVIPAGFMIADGRSLSAIKYPDLFKIIKYTYGGSEDKFNLPDFSDGKFARSTGGSAERLGVAQGDAIRNITGEINTSAEDYDYNNSARYNNGNYIGKGAFDKVTRDNTHRPTLVAVGKTQAWMFDASRVVPTADENRPKNLSVVKLIKVKYIRAKDQQIVYEYINNKPLGVDQDWVEYKVGVERKHNETYKNDTGRPIMVSICYTYRGDHSLNIYVDDKLVAGGVGGKQVIVPNGSKYRAELLASAQFTNWAELR